MKESFTVQIKNELIAIDREQPQAFLAFCYGLFAFSTAFSLSSMYLKTENRALADVYAACAMRLAGVKAGVRTTKGGTSTCQIKNESDRQKILSAFSLTGKEFTMRINRTNIDSESCYADFLAGVFCACGMVADPNKDYHLEFAVSYHRLSKDLIKLMEDVEIEPPLKPKYVTRNYDIVIYFKGSEAIEDLLMLMGAQSMAFRLMDIKIEKDLRNRANRIKNCDSANLDKVIRSGVKQAKAIRRIKNKRGFESIDEDLRELAQLRMEHPEMSLSELQAQLTVPISRSGVNHRLHKLMKMAEEL